MRIELRMGSGYSRLVKRLGDTAAGLIEAVDKGLTLGAHSAAAHIIRTKLSGQSLGVRTGNLRRALTGWLDSSGTAAVGIKSPAGVDDYAWLLMSGTRTIRPKNAKRLAIPLAAALTSAGVPRFPQGPRSVDGLFFVRTKSGNELLARKKTGGGIEPMFALKESVTITASDALPDGVKEHTDAMTDIIQTQLDSLWNKG